MAVYVPQILRKLAPGGVAFIHHSNLLAYGQKIGVPHGRAVSVSADVVAELVKRGDGKILIQEIVDWGCDHLIDCFSLFTRRDSFPSAQAVRLENSIYMGEAKLIRHFQSPYSKIAGNRRSGDSAIAGAA